MVGVAVNVTEVPAQIAPAGTAAILTPAVNIGFTVIVMPLDVAGDPAKQGVALDVIVTVITSLLAKPVVV